MLHTPFACRVPLSAGILPKRVPGKVQGNMSSQRPRRASCHSHADLAQDIGIPGSGCGLQKVPSWCLTSHTWSVAAGTVFRIRCSQSYI